MEMNKEGAYTLGTFVGVVGLGLCAVMLAEGVSDGIIVATAMVIFALWIIILCFVEAA